MKERMEDFGAVIGKYKKLIFSVVYNTAGYLNETEDIAQEVFIKIYKHLKEFRNEADMKTWIYRIALTTSIDHLRRAKRYQAVGLDETAISDSGSTDAPVIKREERELVRRAIDELPVKQRAVLILKEIENLSYRDIANVLKCRIGTVESRLFRARALLREKLEKYRGELK